MVKGAEKTIKKNIMFYFDCPDEENDLSKKRHEKKINEIFYILHSFRLKSMIRLLS